MAPSGRQQLGGQRLEHWRYAWDAGREKPLTGWGMAGYLQDKAVAWRQANTNHVMEYIYAHNEVLDVFVKTGLVGVGVLLIWMGVPIALFLAQSAPPPNHGRPARSVEGADGGCASVRAVHSCVVHGLWLTQVFLPITAGSCLSFHEHGCLGRTARSAAAAERRYASLKRAVS